MNTITVTVQLDSIDEVIESNGVNWQTVGVSVPGNKPANTTKLRLLFWSGSPLLAKVDTLKPKDKFLVFGDLVFGKEKTDPYSVRVTNAAFDLPKEMPEINDLILADAYFAEPEVREGKEGKKLTKVGVNQDRQSSETDDAKTWITVEATGNMARKLAERHDMRSQFNRKVVVRGALREWYTDAADQYGPKRFLALAALTNPADASRDGGGASAAPRQPQVIDTPDFQP